MEPEFHVYENEQPLLNSAPQPLVYAWTATHSPMGEVLAFVKRRIARTPLEIGAFIERGDGVRPLPCMVVDMSAQGAGVFAADTALPNEFTLMLADGSSLRCRCRVVWRRGFMVGVQFVHKCSGADDIVGRPRSANPVAPLTR